MSGSDPTRHINRCNLVWPLLLLLSGCALLPSDPPPPEPLPEPPPVVKLPPPPPEKEPEPLVITPEPEPEPIPQVVAAPPKEVAIVLSSRAPAYVAVASELEQRLKNFTVFDLGDKSEPPVSAFRRIKDSNNSAVVAIGLRAAISATSMSEEPVVFCQVFNINEHELLTDNTRAIAALPPLDLQIAAWKKIDPELKRIGAIVGPGHEELVAEARLAAETHGVELRIETATSDRQTLYLFNRMVRELDGFWLFPDNRVLSGGVLQKMLSDANRHRVQIAVFNESLLDMGAAVSSTSDAADIAATIVDVLEQIAAEGVDSVPEVSPLSDIRIVTNREVLDRLMQSRQERQARLADSQ